MIMNARRIGLTGAEARLLPAARLLEAAREITRISKSLPHDEISRLEGRAYFYLRRPASTSARQTHHQALSGGIIVFTASPPYRPLLVLKMTICKASLVIMRRVS